VCRLPGRPRPRQQPLSGDDQAELRAGLDLLPTWALEHKAPANRQVTAVMRQRLAAWEQVARMYQEPGLAWLERQAEVAEDLVAGASRQRTALGRDRRGGETRTPRRPSPTYEVRSL
jgi:hypothetical protein